MRFSQSIRRTLPYAVGFLAGILAATAIPAMMAQEKPKPEVEKKVAKEEPAYRGLDANLYMQTAAEYRACCLQAYQFGSNIVDRFFEKQYGIERLDLPVADRHSAVVMDLDETVLDNGAFQSCLLRNNLPYQQTLWDDFEGKHGDEVALVPGAKEFIQRMIRLNVNIFYITNRNDKFKDKTLKLLDRLGIAVPAEQLLCATKTSDKTERRQKVEKDYNVLLYFGDNLRDFDDKYRIKADSKKTTEEIKEAIELRKKQVDSDGKMWGKAWIILPNPAYGEWNKVLGRGEKDLELLAPSAKLGQ